jgi:hypothetical protein
MSEKRVTAHNRRIVAARARECCEYCQSQLLFSADPFVVEHIRPKSRGGTNELDNLALACQGCNGFKYDKVAAEDPMTGEVVPLFHPRKDHWDEHFVWSEDFALIIGLTPTGRATVEALQLNREGVVNIRKALFVMGEHPPKP